MRPTIRSVTVSFCLMLGLASYSVVNAGNTGTHNGTPTIIAAK